jgi:hypothetical protein
MGAKAFSVTTQDYIVTSARRKRSSSSLSTLRGHPRHYNATPGTVTTSLTLWKRTGTGRHHDHRCTSYGLSLTPPSSRPADDGRTVNHYAITLEAAPVRAQDSPRRPAGARFARTTVNSATLLAMASHVGKIVRHTCKLLSPWPIKGGAIPQPQGDNRDDRHTYTPFAPHHDIGTHLNQYLRDLEDQPPLPPRL